MYEESHAEQGTIELETAKHFTCSRPSVRRLAATTSVTTSRGRGRSSRFWSGTTSTRGTIARWAPFNTKVIATKTGLSHRHTFIIAITFSTFFPVGQSMLGTINQSFPQIPFVSRLQKNQINWNNMSSYALSTLNSPSSQRTVATNVVRRNESHKMLLIAFNTLIRTT